MGQKFERNQRVPTVNQTSSSRIDYKPMFIIEGLVSSGKIIPITSLYVIPTF